MIKNLKLFINIIFVCLMILLARTISEWNSIASQNRRVPGACEYDYYMMNEFGKETE